MSKKSGLFALLIFILAVIIYKYSVHPLVLKSLFSEKIWVHRVNSLVKLEETSSSFKGVELDIVWENNYFDINHPPVKSINLSLSEYFSSLPNSKKIGIWLDYKNLTEDNAYSSAEYLDSLTRHYNFNKSNIFVESRFPQYLLDFQKKGFTISYYLPPGLNELENDNIYELKELINSKLNANKDIYISAPFSDYSYMHKHFPEKNKLLWHLGSLKGLSKKLNIYRALLDSKVKVVLLPYRSEMGDR